MNRKLSNAALHRRPLALLLPLILGLTGQAAWAADAGWVATATKAFVPAVLQASAPASSSTAQLQASLRSASRDATALPHSDTRPITVLVTLKPRNAAALDRWLAQRLNQHPLPALSQAELDRRYTPTQAQVDAVVSHLKNAGFSQIQVAPNRLQIRATGRAAAVQTAFHTGLNHFQYQGRDVITNTDDAQVPPALAGIVQSVIGLQTAVQAHTLHHVLAPGTAAGTRAQQAGQVVTHETPDFVGIYNAGSLPTGHDTTVGIVTAYDLSDTLSNLKRFAVDHQLALPPVQVIKTDSGTYQRSPDATEEWSLDSQTILGVSGGVQKLQFFNAPDLGLTGLLSAYNAAVNDGSAKVINVSLGIDESAAHADGSQASEDTIFKLATARGQTFSVAAGDEGVYEASNGQVPLPFFGNPAAYSVGDPASSPYVAAIGGTQVSTQGNNGYAGEVTWNEGVQNGKLWATGGGISKYEPVPSWQAAALSSKLTTGKRVLPDFAFDASSPSGARIFANNAYQAYGGTSLAAPIFAGLWARLQTANANNLGFAPSELYPLASANPTVLHDVVQGNNGYRGYGYKAGPGWDYTTGWGSFDTAAVQGLLQGAR